MLTATDFPTKTMMVLCPSCDEGDRSFCYSCQTYGWVDAWTELRIMLNALDTSFKWETVDMRILEQQAVSNFLEDKDLFPLLKLISEIKRNYGVTSSA